MLVAAEHGPVVGIVEHQGHIIVACRYAVYRMKDERPFAEGVDVSDLDDPVTWELLLQVDHPPIVTEKGVLEDIKL